MAHFVAHVDSIVAMCFNSSGVLLLMADRKGHWFNLFQIQRHLLGFLYTSVYHLFILHRYRSHIAVSINSMFKCTVFLLIVSWTKVLNNKNNDNEYDSNHISTDWEAVPLVACLKAMPGSNISRKQISTQSSIAGGLVSSTATSLVSI